MGLPSPGRRRRLGLVVLAGAAVVVTAAAAAPASAASSRHIIPGSTPRWLAQARSLGDTPAAQRVGFGVLLKMRDAAGAVSTLADISDPNSANYGKWLSNAQFRSQYAPAAGDVSAVTGWLAAQGFSVDHSLAGGMYIEASGTAAQVNKAFGTTVKNYSYAGRTVRANATALSFAQTAPSSVVGVVSGVLGLDQAAQMHKPADTLPGPPPGGRFGVQPCSAYYAQKIATDQPSAYGKKQPYAVCGYAPAQYQAAYGESGLIRAGIDGRGVTVAITDAYAAPTILADSRQSSRVHGQPQLRGNQFRQITPAPDGYSDIDECDAQGWYGEETLDVEAVHAMAPGAKIVYVAGSNCFEGLDNAWAETIDNHVADVISNSWGAGTDDVNVIGQEVVDFYTQFSLEAALTGITVNFSTGDAGDLTGGGADPGAKSVEFPADVPYVTGVGGTSVGISRTGQRLWEYGWQNAYATLDNGAWATPPGTYGGGGGGGTSVLYAQPFYQRGKVPTRISEFFGNTPMRAIPDISMPADPNTGFLVGETQVFPDGTYWDEYRLGGTSLSSPLLAGVVAVADQVAHHSLGFVNPLYYKLLGSPAVRDITAPAHPVAEVRTDFTNGVDNTDGKFFRLQTIDVQSSLIHSTPGYDDETGVGTPGGPLFFLALPAVAGHR